MADKALRRKKYNEVRNFVRHPPDPCVLKLFLNSWREEVRKYESPTQYQTFTNHFFSEQKLVSSLADSKFGIKKCFHSDSFNNLCFKWTKYWKSILFKIISHKQSVMTEPIPVKSWFLLLFVKIIIVKKCNNLYLGLVMPSSGW